MLAPCQTVIKVFSVLDASLNFCIFNLSLLRVYHFQLIFALFFVCFFN